LTIEIMGLRKVGEANKSEGFNIYNGFEVRASNDGVGALVFAGRRGD